MRELKLVSKTPTASKAVSNPAKAEAKALSIKDADSLFSMLDKDSNGDLSLEESETSGFEPLRACTRPTLDHQWLCSAVRCSRTRV